MYRYLLVLRESLESILDEHEGSFDHQIGSINRYILLKSQQELNQIIKLLPKNTLIESFNILADYEEDGEEFIKELKEKQKPEDLELGKTEKEG